MCNNEEKLINAFKFYRLIRQVSRQIEVSRDKVARIVNISGAQLYILWNLYVDEKLNYTELAHKSGLAQNSLSPLIRPLLLRKLIKQESEPADGRITYLLLTPKGMEIMRQVIDVSLSISPEGLNYLNHALIIGAFENKDVISRLKIIIEQNK